ncbi:DUF2807 domain-containing protein, partial [Oceanispirochaeta sp.]|uniref:GIN domain-containing protein n=1 Tax=Oceanispirochaeta sp. TaxID=2035350 RepID=UPI002635C50A
MNQLQKLLILSVLSLASLSCQNYPDASDVLVEQTYSFSEFDSISGNSAFEVYASYGESYSVSITVNEDQFDNLDVSVSDGELIIDYSSSEDYNNLQFTADITLPELNRVHLYDRAVIFFYDRTIGTDNRSNWNDSFSEIGKTLEILLDGEYSHASFDMEVPPLPEGTLYLYSRSDFSAYNRTHTVNAKELVIHSEADNASSSVTLRSETQPDLMIVQADHYGTLSM